MFSRKKSPPVSNGVDSDCYSPRKKFSGESNDFSRNMSYSEKMENVKKIFKCYKKVKGMKSQIDEKIEDLKNNQEEPLRRRCQVGTRIGYRKWVNIRSDISRGIQVQFKCGSRYVYMSGNEAVRAAKWVLNNLEFIEEEQQQLNSRYEDEEYDDDDYYSDGEEEDEDEE